MWAPASLAITYRDTGRLAEAGSLQKEIRTLRQETLGLGHHETTLAMGDLALNLGRYQDALTLQTQVLSSMKETFCG